jgi:uncharacterized 2Fe-2S/4Fe-4S cluster protein (DUF4445 family)
MYFEGTMQNADVLKSIPRRFAVRFANLDREVEAFEGETLIQCARRSGVRIDGACGGRGVCGSCMVRILSGKFDFLHSSDVGQADSELNKEWVRACLVRPLSDCIVEVSPRVLAPVARTDFEIDEPGAAIAVQPAVQTHEVNLVASDTVAAGADLERLFEAMGEETADRIDIIALGQLPQSTCENDVRLRVHVRDGELIGFSSPGKRTLGLAVDLGTTNAAAFLVDLETGVRLASQGIENPQVTFGADLITRVNHAIRTEDGSRELQTAIVSGIKALASDLCDVVSASLDEIVDITVCCNTAMHHLLLGLPVSRLGRAPFVATACTALDVKARDLDLHVLPGAYVHVLPNIAGFVGGDHVAALMATEPLWLNSTTIVMDIGTNTEISLVHRGEITSVSCPSGPALEGGHISAGMRAAEGAIERVCLVDGQIETQVIGGVPAVGLCGSGVLDAIATLLRSGIIDTRGRFHSDSPNVYENNGRLECVLAPDVALTQDDVRAVQLAKAAIRAGVDLLLRESGLREQSIESFVIAGAFGAYIDIPNAIDIGLFPPLPQKRFIQVGNAAGVGVRMALVSTQAREHASSLAARCQHIELNKLPDFQKVFVDRISFN